VDYKYSNSVARGIIKAIAFFLVLGLLLFVLYQIRYLIAYIAIAFVIALIGRPLVSFLSQKLRMGKTIGATITLIVIFGLMVGLVAMFVPMLTEQGKNLVLYNLEGIRTELDTFYTQISDYFGTTKEVVEKAVEENGMEKGDTEEVGTKYVPTLIETVLSIFTQFSVGLFSTLFIAFFVMKDQNSLQRFALAIVPPDQRIRAIKSLQKIKVLLSRYFVGLILQIAILFIVYSATLLFVETEFALIIAFFCALFNIVPYIGPLVGAFLMALLTITSHSDMDLSSEVLPLVGYVLIGVIIGQLIDNFFSQPLIYSSSIKSHPLEIFTVIIAAGLLFGVIGMIVAVPGYAVLKVISKELLRENTFVRTWTKGI